VAVVGDAYTGATELHLHKSKNKTKYLMILEIHKSIKSEFRIKLNKAKLENAWCHYSQNFMIPICCLTM